MEVNAYNSTAGASSSVNSSDTKSSGEKTLGMSDFLNLLVAQLANQDPMNPMENTEFISQLAQFSSLQAMSDMKEAAMTMQATSLIGKNVIAADYDMKGRLVTTEGKVDKVTLFKGEAMIYIGEKAFGFSNIMEIKGDEAAQPPEEPDPSEEPDQSNEQNESNESQEVTEPAS